MGLLRKEAEVSEMAIIGFTTIQINESNKLLIHKSIFYGMDVYWNRGIPFPAGCI